MEKSWRVKKKQPKPSIHGNSRTVGKVSHDAPHDVIKVMGHSFEESILPVKIFYFFTYLEISHAHHGCIYLKNSDFLKVCDTEDWYNGIK